LPRQQGDDRQRVAGQGHKLYLIPGMVAVDISLSFARLSGWAVRPAPPVRGHA
jgi:hypothetical protein